MLYKTVHNTYQASLCLLCLQTHLGGPEAQANQNYLLVLEFPDLERLSGLEFPAYQVLLTDRHRLESLWHPKIIHLQRLPYEILPAIYYTLKTYLLSYKLTLMRENISTEYAENQYYQRCFY